MENDQTGIININKAMEIDANDKSEICEVKECGEDSINSTTLNFLKQLYLDQYYDALRSHGGTDVDHLIYLDDNQIDELAGLCGMRMIHASVFKKAIKESRGDNVKQDVSKEVKKRKSSCRNCECCHGCSRNYQDSYECFGHNDAKRIPYSNSFYDFQHFFPPYPPYPPPNIFNRPIRRTGDLEASNTQKQQKCPELIPLKLDTKPPSVKDSVTFELKEKYPVRQQPEKRQEELQDNYDGPYQVKIREKYLVFPPTVKRLTKEHQLDEERKIMIKKASQIFGREDGKKRSTTLSPSEIAMNEIAYEVCVRDFTYVLCRQLLLNVVREIIRDNQGLCQSFQVSQPRQSSANVSQQPLVPIPPLIPKRQSIAPSIVPPPIIPTNKPEVSTSEPKLDFSQDSEMSDYNIVLYRKIHNEWPKNISNERRKQVGRVCSNFKAVENILYYIKDGKCRQWIVDESDIFECFMAGHVNRETGDHYSKDITLKNIMPYYYVKNLSEIVTNLFGQCNQCKSQRPISLYQNSYGIPTAGQQNLIPVNEKDNPVVYVVNQNGELVAPTPDIVPSQELADFEAPQHEDPLNSTVKTLLNDSPTNEILNSSDLEIGTEITSPGVMNSSENNNEIVSGLNN